MLRIGTCSWKYPSWAGLVYTKADGVDYLAEYATRYSTVEVDQWFWAPPDPSVARAYARSVPPVFRFTVKVFNGVTWGSRRSRGRGEEPNPDFLSLPLLLEFVERLDEMRPLVGALMLQFDYLNSTRMPDPHAFLARLEELLAALPAGLPVAVETRNPNLVTARYFKMLQRHNVGHVFLEGYWMPPVSRVYEKARALLAGTQVMRLHGPDRGGIEERTGGSWDRIVDPRDQELADIVTTARDMTERGMDLYLNVNNHYEGSAPLTIERLAALGLVDPAAPRPPPADSG